MATTKTDIPNTHKTLYRVSVEGELFKIELAGDSETEYAITKAQAIERAKVLARRAPLGGVIVIGRDGRVEQEIDVDSHRNTR